MTTSSFLFCRFGTLGNKRAPIVMPYNKGKCLRRILTYCPTIKLVLFYLRFVHVICRWSSIIYIDNSSNKDKNIILFIQALDGFLFVVNTEGRVEYVTDNITQYINYTKDDVLGKDIYNIIHHGDHNTFMPSLLPMSLGMYFNRIIIDELLTITSLRIAILNFHGIG